MINRSIKKGVLFLKGVLISIFALTVQTAKTVDFSQLIKKLNEGKSSINEAITGLEDGMKDLKETAVKKLETELLDPLNKSLNDAKSQSSDLRDALSPLSSMPSLIEQIVVNVAYISDLKPTIQWIINNPLQEIETHLQTVIDLFGVIVKSMKTDSTEGKKLYEDFNESIRYFKDANMKIDQIIQALQSQ